jgi:hypothetical protein
MPARPRYRFEDGVHWVDIKLANIEQLFDNRDPAPFRERDLDPDLVEYLVDAAEDLAGDGPFRIAFWFPTERNAEEIAHAFRAHFEYELERVERRRRRRRRTGQVALVVGIVLLLALLFAAQLIRQVLPEGNAREAVREGLIIFSWVALWRPVDNLIYEWIPERRMRRLLTTLHDAPIEVRIAPVPTRTRPPVRVEGDSGPQA